MKSILVPGLLFCFAVLPLHVTAQEHDRADKAASQADKGVTQDADKGKANSTGNPIEVKTNRFSSAVTVTLKPQTLLDTPDQVITMEIETKLEEKRSDDVFRDSITTIVHIKSDSKKLTNYGDEEINILINGQRRSGPPGEFKIQTVGRKEGFALPRRGALVLDSEELELLTKANRIEMQVGSTELTLSKAMVSTLREYAIQTLAQHKIVNKR